jgi:hypothetical protein
LPAFDDVNQFYILSVKFSLVSPLSFLTSTLNDREQNPSVQVHVFTDADISERPDDVAQALRESKVLFCSLVVDFVQVQWIKERYVSLKELESESGMEKGE